MNHEPGWDAKAIARISRNHFGGMEEMFVAHGWPERGNKMMPAVQKHVAAEYGAVLAFVKKYESKTDD